jgi:pimeloyl-ACP methyl ester carboxylesterase
VSAAQFTARHRGGAGEPLLLLHGFTDTWRTWELVLGALERRHEVLAPTLAGHAGGPPIDPDDPERGALDAIERLLDAAGWKQAHIAGNSLGGYLALRLAERGRARSVVALAPAGGWAPGDLSWHELLAFQIRLQASAQWAAPHAGSMLATARGRRAATEYVAVNFEHIPVELITHQLLGVAACTAAPALVEHARTRGWNLAAERIDCPVRIVWGTEDRLLPWPSAAARYRRDWLPHVDWVELEGVGHCPQLDVPAVAAELIAGFTVPSAAASGRSRRPA